MIGYTIRRLLFSAFILAGAVSVVFIVLRMIPADPAALILGTDASPEELAAMRTRMGLDQPLIVQYGRFLFDLVQLDFGDSYRLRKDAMELVLQRLPATTQLASAALAIAIVIGVPFGVIAALNVGKATDRIVSALSLLSQSLPGFWVGIVLIMIFARTLRLLPSAGMGTFAHLILPAVTLALPFIAILTRMTRSGLLEVIALHPADSERA